MTSFESRYWWWFRCTILFTISALLSPIQWGEFKAGSHSAHNDGAITAFANLDAISFQGRQIVHTSNPTISLAHFPTLPLVIRPMFDELPLLAQAERDSRNLSARVTLRPHSSLEHRSERAISCVRYCNKFVRNARHVRDRLCRLLRSREHANDAAILLLSVHWPETRSAYV